MLVVSFGSLSVLSAPHSSAAQHVLKKIYDRIHLRNDGFRIQLMNGFALGRAEISDHSRFYGESCWMLTRTSFSIEIAKARTVHIPRLAALRITAMIGGLHMVLSDAKLACISSIAAGWMKAMQTDRAPRESAPALSQAPASNLETKTPSLPSVIWQQVALRILIDAVSVTLSQSRNLDETMELQKEFLRRIHWPMPDTHPKLLSSKALDRLPLSGIKAMIPTRLEVDGVEYGDLCGLHGSRPLLSLCIQQLSVKADVNSAGIEFGLHVGEVRVRDLFFQQYMPCRVSGGFPIPILQSRPRVYREDEPPDSRGFMAVSCVLYPFSQLSPAHTAVDVHMGLLDIGTKLEVIEIAIDVLMEGIAAFSPPPLPAESTVPSSDARVHTVLPNVPNAPVARKKVAFADEQRNHTTNSPRIAMDWIAQLFRLRRQFDSDLDFPTELKSDPEILTTTSGILSRPSIAVRIHIDGMMVHIIRRFKPVLNADGSRRLLLALDGNLPDQHDFANIMQKPSLFFDSGLVGTLKVGAFQSLLEMGKFGLVLRTALDSLSLPLNFDQSNQIKQAPVWPKIVQMGLGGATDTPGGYWMQSGLCRDKLRDFESVLRWSWADASTLGARYSSSSGTIAWGCTGLFRVFRFMGQSGDAETVDYRFSRAPFVVDLFVVSPELRKVTSNLSGIECSVRMRELELTFLQAFVSDLLAILQGPTLLLKPSPRAPSIQPPPVSPTALPPSQKEASTSPSLCLDMCNTRINVPLHSASQHSVALNIDSIRLQSASLMNISRRLFGDHGILAANDQLQYGYLSEPAHRAVELQRITQSVRGAKFVADLAAETVLQNTLGGAIEGIYLGTHDDVLLHLASINIQLVIGKTPGGVDVMVNIPVFMCALTQARYRFLLNLLQCNLSEAWTYQNLEIPEQSQCQTIDDFHDWTYEPDASRVVSSSNCQPVSGSSQSFTVAVKIGAFTSFFLMGSRGLSFKDFEALPNVISHSGDHSAMHASGLVRKPSVRIMSGIALEGLSLSLELCDDGMNAELLLQSLVMDYRGSKKCFDTMRRILVIHSAESSGLSVRLRKQTHLSAPRKPPAYHLIPKSLEPSLAYPMDELQVQISMPSVTLAVSPVVFSFLDFLAENDASPVVSLPVAPPSDSRTTSDAAPPASKSSSSTFVVAEITIGSATLAISDMKEQPFRNHVNIHTGLRANAYYDVQNGSLGSAVDVSGLTVNLEKYLVQSRRTSIAGSQRARGLLMAFVRFAKYVEAQPVAYYFERTDGIWCQKRMFESFSIIPLPAPDAIHVILRPFSLHCDLQMNTTITTANKQVIPSFLVAALSSPDFADITIGFRTVQMIQDIITGFLASIPTSRPPTMDPNVELVPPKQTNPIGDNPTITDPHALSQNVSIVLPGTRIIFINDFEGNVPLVYFSLRKAHICYSAFHFQARKLAQVHFGILSDFYEPQADRWEPFIEKCRMSIFYMAPEPLAAVSNPQAIMPIGVPNIPLRHHLASGESQNWSMSDGSYLFQLDDAIRHCEGLSDARPIVQAQPSVLYCEKHEHEENAATTESEVFAAFLNGDAHAAAQALLLMKTRGLIMPSPTDPRESIKASTNLLVREPVTPLVPYDSFLDMRVPRGIQLNLSPTFINGLLRWYGQLGASSTSISAASSSIASLQVVNNTGGNVDVEFEPVRSVTSDSSRQIMVVRHDVLLELRGAGLTDFRIEGGSLTDGLLMQGPLFFYNDKKERWRTVTGLLFCRSHSLHLCIYKRVPSAFTVPGVREDPDRPPLWAQKGALKIVELSKGWKVQLLDSINERTHAPARDLLSFRSENEALLLACGSSACTGIWKSVFDQFHLIADAPAIPGQRRWRLLRNAIIASTRNSSTEPNAIQSMLVCDSIPAGASRACDLQTFSLPEELRLDSAITGCSQSQDAEQLGLRFPGRLSTIKLPIKRLGFFYLPTDTVSARTDVVAEVSLSEGGKRLRLRSPVKITNELAFPMIGSFTYPDRPETLLVRIEPGDTCWCPLGVCAVAFAPLLDERAVIHSGTKAEDISAFGLCDRIDLNKGRQIYRAEDAESSILREVASGILRLLSIQTSKQKKAVQRIVNDLVGRIAGETTICKCLPSSTNLDVSAFICTLHIKRPDFYDEREMKSKSFIFAEEDVFSLQLTLLPVCRVENLLPFPVTLQAFPIDVEDSIEGKNATLECHMLQGHSQDIAFSFAAATDPRKPPISSGRVQFTDPSRYAALGWSRYAWSRRYVYDTFPLSGTYASGQFDIEFRSGTGGFAPLTIYGERSPIRPADRPQIASLAAASGRKSSVAQLLAEFPEDVVASAFLKARTALTERSGHVRLYAKYIVLNKSRMPLFFSDSLLRQPVGACTSALGNRNGSEATLKMSTEVECTTKSDVALASGGQGTSKRLKAKFVEMLSSARSVIPRGDVDILSFPNRKNQPDMLIIGPVSSPTDFAFYSKPVALSLSLQTVVSMHAPVEHGTARSSANGGMDTVTIYVDPLRLDCSSMGAATDTSTMTLNSALVEYDIATRSRDAKKACHLSVEVQAAPDRFFRTRVVKVMSAYQLFNRSDYMVHFRQCPSAEVCISVCFLLSC
jgi:hypothetical protein